MARRTTKKAVASKKRVAKKRVTKVAKRAKTASKKRGKAASRKSVFSFWAE